MIVYRIQREKYLKSTLQGFGAAKSKDFRWNSEETRLVYTTESRALALLEIAVHLNLSEELPTDRFIVEIDIPYTISALEVNINDLPTNWNSKPPTAITQLIGDDFVFSNEAAVLKVPSAIIPQEFNYLINPLHPDAAQIKVKKKSLLQFDERLKF